MSSFFVRTMILLLVVDLNRSFASIQYDNVTDTEHEDNFSGIEYEDNFRGIEYDDVADAEHEVISLEKKNFKFVTIVDCAPFRVTSGTKFEQFVAVLCGTKAKNQYGYDIMLSHIRIYESRHPFSLLFVIYIGDIDDPGDIAWNNKAESLFVINEGKSVWQIKWKDHLVRKFSCPLDSDPRTLSFSNDGHVLITGINDNNLYICNNKGTLIRKIPCVQDVFYMLNTPFGQYIFLFSRYDPRLNARMGYSKIDLHLREMNEFNVESILDVNATNESNVTSTNTERFSFFIVNQSRDKCSDFDIFKVTIERRSKITKNNLRAECSASDERLFVEFLSNSRDRFFYMLHGMGCSDPLLPEWPELRAERMMAFSASYSHDYLIFVDLSNSFIVTYAYIVEFVP